jgi:hypothetical protein
MFESLTAPDLTLLFLGIVVCLGSALVWMVWQIEQQLGTQRERFRDET